MPNLRIRSPRDRLVLAGALPVSPICVGMIDRPEVIPAAFDAGVNFFFVSADMHWPGYAATRRGLELLFERGGGVRDQVVVAGVSYVTQPEFCSGTFEELVAEVRRLERLDVLVAGGVYGHEFPARLPVYQQHRTQQHCGARAIGASFHERLALIGPSCDGSLDVSFLRYNSRHARAREDVLPALAARKALVFNFTSTRGFVSPERCDELGLEAEMWRPTISDHYRFVFSREEIDGVLCSPKTPEQLDAMLEALEEGPLSEDEQEHLMLLSKLA